MCEYLAICDSTFAAVTSSCSWHIALGVGTLFFGPIIVIILAMLRLTFYIRKHEDECYEKRPKPPSLVAVFRWSPRTRKARARAFSPCQASRAAWHHRHYPPIRPHAGVPCTLSASLFLKRPDHPDTVAVIRSVRRAKTLLGKWVLLKVYFQNSQVRGDWNDADSRILRWSWLISDYTRATWGFALWLLVRRLYMSATVNLTDGTLNAGLSLAAQVVDTALIITLRPFNDHKTNAQEALGALANVLAYFAITLPILASPDFLPVWMDDTATLVLSVFATGVAALFAMLGPLFSVIGLVKAACSKLPSLIPEDCLTVKSTAVGGAVGVAAQESMANVQDELTGMFEEYLDERFLEGDADDDDDDDQDETGEDGYGQVGALAAGVVLGDSVVKWQNSLGDPTRSLQMQAADQTSGVSNQARERILIHECQLASLLADGPQHVLAELGFTQGQITSARESMRYFYSRSPRSGRDDQEVLTWLLATNIQPQGQADTRRGSTTEAYTVTATLGHVSPRMSPCEPADTVLLRSRRVRTTGEGWWVGEKSPEPLHPC
jgi:hypothetical protein